MENPQKLAITVPEVADTLGCAEATGWKYIADGTIPSFRLGKCRRISVDVLRAWMRQQADQVSADDRSASAA